MSEEQTTSTADYPTGNLGPDPVDTRDRLFLSSDDIDDLPPQTRAFDQKFLSDLPPVYDQAPFGSCTVNAVLAALRYAHHKLTKTGYEAWEPSRMFLYRNARIRTESTKTDPIQRLNSDYGTYSRTCMTSLLMDGVCSEKLWPYGGSFDNLAVKPNPVEPVDLNAAQYEGKGSSHPRDPASFLGRPDFVPRAISYYRIFIPSDASDVNTPAQELWQYRTHPPIAMLEQCLRLGFPFVFSIWLASNVDIKDGLTADGSFPEVPQPFVQAGGHSMLAVGFDSEKKRFLVQNSWGKTYNGNMEGKVWIPYSWFTATFEGSIKGVKTAMPVAYDFWVVKYGE